MSDLTSARAAWENFYVIVGSSGLLFVGIHNAWDTVTHIVVTESEDGPNGG